jgi:hypothetical protein
VHVEDALENVALAFTYTYAATAPSTHACWNMLAGSPPRANALSAVDPWLLLLTGKQRPGVSLACRSSRQRYVAGLTGSGYAAQSFPAKSAVSGSGTVAATLRHAVRRPSRSP